jgi:hypothetical protein
MSGSGSWGQLLLGVVAVGLLQACASPKIDIVAYKDMDIGVTALSQKGAVERLPMRSKVAVYVLPNEGVNQQYRDVDLQSALKSSLEGATADAALEVADAIVDKLNSNDAKIRGTVKAKAKGCRKGPCAELEHIIVGRVVDASAGSSQTLPQSKTCRDKKGRSFDCSVKASTVKSGAATVQVRVMDSDTGQLLESYRWEGSDSSSTEGLTTLQPGEAQQLIRGAVKNAVEKGSWQLKRTFPPRGYVMAGRTNGSEFIFKISGGKQAGMSIGQKILLARVEHKNNPLTGKRELNELPVARGIVSSEIDSEFAWVLVKEKEQAEKVQAGDLAKVSFEEKGF